MSYYYHNCAISLGLISVFFLILDTIFTFIYKKYDFENNPIVLEIQNELNTILINSFEERDSCLEDEEKLILGQWDGSTEGCLCDDKVYKRK